MPTSTPPQPDPTITFNAEGQRVLECLDTTSTHVFLTGKAGTGKSTLLQHFRAITSKKLVVLAPTGVAAVNVGGQTIHSFCHFRPGITLDKVRTHSSDKNSIYKQLDMIIIGRTEAQMSDGRYVEADLAESFFAEILGQQASDDPLIMGDQVLLGVTLLEKMDLLVDCPGQRVMGNPAHPDQPAFQV